MVNFAISAHLDPWSTVVRNVEGHYGLFARYIGCFPVQCIVPFGFQIGGVMDFPFSSHTNFVGLFIVSLWSLLFYLVMELGQRLQFDFGWFRSCGEGCEEFCSGFAYWLYQDILGCFMFSLN